MEFTDIKQLESNHQLKTYAKFDFSIERGEGAYVVDSAGKKYLDFYGGHAVCITGHCHPKIIAAICEQAKQLIFYSNIVYQSTRAEASAALLKLAGPNFSKVFLCNSGAEANEAAIKMVRNHTGRTQIIAMKNGFHGRTCGALSITGIEKYRTFLPLMPGVTFAEFGNLQSLEEILQRGPTDSAAVILEPIQSMAGIHIATATYYRELRSLCDKYGVLLVFDEVQTGFGRTGKNFFGEHFGIAPDLITCAKGMGSGIPIGGVFVSEAIASKIGLSDHGTTFGGGPVACAAAKATVEIILEEKLTANAAHLGQYILDSIGSTGIRQLKAVRGIGLMIGIEFSGEAKKVMPELLKRGVIIGTSEDSHTLRLLPPLIITKAQCDEVVQKIKESADVAFC